MGRTGLSAQLPKPPINPKRKGKSDSVSSKHLNRESDAAVPGTAPAGDIICIWMQTRWN